ncbi:pentapeptide repeat-containing protein [Mycobacterium sp. BMJ-28]
MGALTQPLATLLAGSVVAVAALVTFASAALGRRQTQRHFAAQHDADRERDLRDRYTAAATQIGNKESAAVRLAGVYGLAALANDWLLRHNRINAQMTVDLLRGYLRVVPTGEDQVQEHEVRKTILLELKSRTNWWADSAEARHPNPPERRREPPKSLLQRMLQRLRAVVSALQERRGRGARNRSGDPRHALFPKSGAWQGLNTDLARAWLVGADLRHIQIAGAYLADANMRSTDLTSADLELVCMSRASLVDARLVGVYARGALLDHADLSGADLRNATFGEVDLEHARLIGADLTGAMFGTGTNLRGANFTGAILDEHNLEALAAEGAILDDPDWRCSCVSHG